jgi:hypothetical protein
MTVGEAAPSWEDPRHVLLKRWGETFGVPLNEFHIGHILTYEEERLADGTTYKEMRSEVLALRALLQHVGLGQQIEAHYTSPHDAVRLTDEERSNLSSRVLAYIEYLERSLSSAESERDRAKTTLRKINWGRKR